MLVTITPAQLAAIELRLSSKCTDIEIRRWETTRSVEVMQFDRRRLIETVRIRPGGNVTVLA